MHHRRRMALGGDAIKDIPRCGNDQARRKASDVNTNEVLPVKSSQVVGSASQRAGQDWCVFSHNEWQ